MGWAIGNRDGAGGRNKGAATEQEDTAVALKALKVSKDIKLRHVLFHIIQLQI